MSDSAQEHADRHGHTVEVIDTYSCANPDCGHILRVDRHLVTPSAGVGAKLRRASRKRDRQNRKRGRR